MPNNSGWNNQITNAYNQIILNAGTNGVVVSSDAAAATCTFGAGAAVKTVTLGSTNSTSATTLQSGSGALAVTSTNGTLTINSGTGALGISTNANATTISIGTGAAAKAITLGSTTTTSSLALKCGTADFSLASATGTIMSAQDTGEITYPLQTAFLATLTSVQNSVSGNGTAYTLGTAALTKVFDQNSDFNTNGTFTAPVTGRYYLGAQGVFTGCTIASSLDIVLLTSNRSDVYNVSRAASSANFYIQANCFMDMDAADTYTCTLTSTGEAANTDNLFGAATTIFTGMWGYLAC